MSAPLSRLQQRFQPLGQDPLAVDGLGEQGGVHGQDDAALEIRAERRPVDPWLVGQLAVIEAFESYLFGPLALGERERR